MKIVIVDDTESIRKVLRAICESEGHEVVAEFGDGLVLLDYVVNHRPDVVCLDYELPGADGLELLVQLDVTANNVDVVGIDEAQFFDEAIVEVCNVLANSGKRVIVAGLDMDYEGKPFGSMPNLLAVAEYVTKVHAICAQTGELASFSYRLSDNETRVLLGEKNAYEARSRQAFFVNQKKRS